MISLGWRIQGGVSWVSPYVAVQNAVSEPDMAWGERMPQM